MFLPRANASRVKWDVFGDAAPPPPPCVRQRVFDEIQAIWSIPRLDPTRLPAPQPATFSRLSDIAGATHVGVKCDGVRAMLLVLARAAVLVDRSFKMRGVEIEWETETESETAAAAAASASSSSSSSLFDGELVDGDANAPVFVIFDAFRVAGQDLTRGVPLERRMQIASDARARWRRLSLAGTLDRLEVDFKTWLRVGDPATRARLADTAATAGPSDGLILWEDNVASPPRLRAGTQPGLFKWKAHHTIDFLWDAREKRLIVRDDGDAPFVSASRHLGVSMCPAWRDRLPTSLHNAVLECTVEKKPVVVVVGGGGGWVATPVCVRDDKQRPNNLVIARRTLDVIASNASFAEILAFVGGDEPKGHVT